MNLLFQLLTVLNLGLSYPQQDIDSSEDQKKVEKLVVEWADASFVKHENYKFEHFKAFYTDEYFIHTMRIEMYEEKITDLKKRKETGSYSGTEEQYKEELGQLEGALKKAMDADASGIKKVTHYQVHFWSNIQTVDGITVYYELIVKLDNDYQITEAIENSSIGKKSSETKIVYKKGVETVQVSEK